MHYSASKKTPAPVVVKKYANRRLYNTATSVYVTLNDLCEMVKEGADFTVQDARTGEDLTRQVLTQIILEQELGGSQLLPVKFLRSVIRQYGEEVQKALPPYLDAMMEHFTQNQEGLAQAMRQSMGNYSPFGSLEEMQKQNMAMFKQAFSVFNPFEKK